MPVQPGCRWDCPDGECHCAEPRYAELIGMCHGCGAIDDCYCWEE